MVVISDWRFPRGFAVPPKRQQEAWEAWFWTDFSGTKKRMVFHTIFDLTLSLIFFVGFEECRCHICCWVP